LSKPVARKYLRAIHWAEWAISRTMVKSHAASLALGGRSQQRQKSELCISLL
jgi:hypothetical protein